MLSYHSTAAKAKFPFTERFIFPKKFKWLNFLFDFVYIIALCLRSSRSLKAGLLAISVWKAIDLEHKAELLKLESADALSRERKRVAELILKHLTTLGGAFIKVGQFTSTRGDLVPPEYVSSLGKLQDSAPSLPPAVVLSTIHNSLGGSPSELFAHFEAKPIAAASIAQVHRITLKDGTECVLKVQRPHLREIILQDVSITRGLCCFLQKYNPWANNRFLPELCDEFGKILYEETDFVQEALNAERMKLNLLPNNPDLVVPEVMWSFVRHNMLVLTYCPGHRVNDAEYIKSLGLQPSEVARRLMNLYYEQLFVHSFFHADPHPGNICLTEEGKIVMYDFGMTYRIAPQIKENMKSTISCLVTKDTDGFVAGLDRMGLLRPNADLPLMKSLIDKVTYKYYGGNTLRDINLEDLREEIDRVVANGPVRMPPSLAYVFRSAGILEGVCRTLDPNFDFIGSLKPLAKIWSDEAAGGGVLERFFVRLLKRFDLGEGNLQAIIDVARLPSQAVKLLSNLETGDIRIPIDLKRLESRIEHIECITQGIAFMMVGVVLCSFGLTIWQLLPEVPSWVDILLALTGVITLAVGFLKITR